MKNKITFFLLALTFSISALAQNKETRSVSTFKEIAFRIPGKLFLTQGDVQKVEIEGSAEALKKIETTVTGNKLVIERDSKLGSGSNEKFNVYITVKNIESLGVGGSGDLVGQNKFIVADLKLNISGSGSIQVEATSSGTLSTDVSGSGHIDLKGNCKEFISDVSGSGKVLITETITGTAKFEISGSGKIEASGSAKQVNTEISGSGQVLAANLEADDCTIRINGSGDAEINVKKSLDANVSGSGVISYKGNPSQVNSNASGSGHVKKM